MSIFSNWSGDLQFRPKTIEYPNSLEAIVALVNTTRAEDRRIRLVGTGHSWMPLIETDDILVSLDEWQGVESVNREAGTAVIRAGTKLSRAGKELYEHKMALSNMGDIDVQSIAGAFFTGTHGTGVNHQILSSQLVGVTIVTADGEVRDWHESTHPDEMNAVRVSFGALGIVAKMEVRVSQSYKLEEKQYRQPLLEVMTQLETLKHAHRHFEFFWFPKTDFVVVKELNETERPPVAAKPFMLFLEDKFFSRMAKWSANAPKIGTWLNRMMIRLVDVETEGTVDHAHLVYPSPRELRFNEMEYNIPAESWHKCFAEIVELYNQPDFPVLFPIECRWVKRDDFWLSPAT